MLPNDALAKHWILNLAVNFPVPLWLLYPAVRVEALNVKEIPGVCADDYAAVLQELLSDRMIQLSGPEGEGPPGLAATLLQLRHLPIATPREMAGMRAGQTAFELTPKGGAAWEALADPEWNHILIESSDLETCELLSPDRNQLMAYMGWYRENHDQAIDLETVTVTQRTDFPILYWKRLASVHHASFHLLPPAASRDSAKPLWSFPWFREWAALRWYRHPWELASWPR